MPKMHLPDINVWLALTFDSHLHHPAAKTWFDALGNDALCFFCRLTQQGFLRLATNPSVFGKDAVTLPDAWQKYAVFLSDPRVAFAGEPAGLETQWRTNLHANPIVFSESVERRVLGCVRTNRRPGNGDLRPGVHAVLDHLHHSFVGTGRWATRASVYE